MNVAKQGVSHHDVKPDNMLVQEESSDNGLIHYNFFPIDWGLSLTKEVLQDRESTQSGIIIISF